LIKSESKNHRFWVFDKMRIKEPPFWSFQNTPRTAGFHERTGKEPEVLWAGICQRYSVQAPRACKVLKLFKALHFRVSLGFTYTPYLAPCTLHRPHSLALLAFLNFCHLLKHHNSREVLKQTGGHQKLGLKAGEGYSGSSPTA
jgi:hypothetical protein